jgi:DNA primase
MSDYEYDYPLTSFFVDQLNSKNIPFRMREKDIAVKCPFHSHSGRKYHLQLSKTGKKAHCWSCGWGKGGKTWNDYAEHEGLELLDDEIIEKTKFDELGMDLFNLSKTYEVEPLVTEPLDIAWTRFGKGPDLPVSFLRKFNAQKYYDDVSETYRLHLPVTIDSELVGWFNMWVDEEFTNYKSLNAKGKDWVKAALYPIDFVRDKTKTAFLVEGQYDALRLLYRSIPALSILGTPNWSLEKVQLLRDFNFERIFLLFDGDTEGERLTPIAYNHLIDYFKVTAIYLPEDRDPGDLTDEEIKKLKKWATQYKDFQVLQIDDFENDIIVVE